MAMTKRKDEETDFQWQSKRQNSDSRRMFCMDDDEDPRLRQIRNLAKMQITMGLLAFIISVVMLSTWPQSAGSSTGTWCTVYIMLFSFMCLGHGGFMHAKFVVPFGVIGMKFAILMVILEVIEVKASFDRTAADNVTGFLHVILGTIGLLELISLILTVFSHTVWKKGNPAGGISAEMTSSEDDQVDHIMNNLDVVLEETKESAPEDEKGTDHKIINAEATAHHSS